MDRLLLLFGLCFCLTTATAQSLIDQLGGVKTEFTLLLNNEPLSVADQYIIKRAVSNVDYAYESYHLEFSLVGATLQQQRKAWQSDYRMFLLDESGNVIASRLIDVGLLTQPSTNQLRFYNGFA